MKRATKWVFITMGAAITLMILAAVIILVTCRNPSVEPIPEAYVNATQIWSSESNKEEVIELKHDQIVAKIHVSYVPTLGTTIHYQDEKSPRYIFPEELYFGATEVKFDGKSGIIYVKVAGKNAVCGPHGGRIFEYDAGLRKSVRDYWVEISE